MSFRRFVGAELKAAEAARASETVGPKPRSNAKNTTPAHSEIEEHLLQQWLDSKEDDTVTEKLDVEVAELISELQPKYPEYTWRDHVYVCCHNLRLASTISILTA